MDNSQVVFGGLPSFSLGSKSARGIQVLDIVAGYFTELPLQSHLQILANSIATRDLGESAREGKGRDGVGTDGHR